MAGFLPDATAFYLKHCVKACHNGVERSHIVPFDMDGSAAGTVHPRWRGHHDLAREPGKLRQATIEDVGGIIKLIEPLEADGTLVKRGRELIEREIDYFSVIEHDGVIFGCAALYPSPNRKWPKWPA
jgi:amino-acid N-acetyltransferase